MNRLAARVSVVAPPLLRVMFGPSSMAMRHWPQWVMKAFVRQLPPPDVMVVSRPEIRQVVLKDFSQMPATAGRAQAQDFVLVGHDWGFRLEDIRIRVHIWHGDADRAVPLAHAHLQAGRIPNSRLHECLGEGHFLFVDHFTEILQTLVCPDPVS